MPVPKSPSPRPRRGSVAVSLVAVHPLTSERFADLEALFAMTGCSFARGCWCMEYRESGRPMLPEGARLADFRKEKMRELAATAASTNKPAPGLIGYDQTGRPVGWISLGPREDFGKLRRSPVMKPVDDRPVWSIVCFVIPSAYRGQGLAGALLAAALEYARDRGALTLEAYPIDKRGHSQDQWLWHGVRSTFEKAGFREVARRKPERPVMRLELAG